MNFGIYSMGDTDLALYSVTPLSAFAVRALLASQDELGSITHALVFLKSFCRIVVVSCLNV